MNLSKTEKLLAAKKKVIQYGQIIDNSQNCHIAQYKLAYN
jgi:hypothetical protein